MQDSPARVLLIAPPGSYRVHAYLEAARDLGIGMLVASEGEHSLVPGIEDGLRVDFGDPDAVIEQIVSAHRDRPVAGVVATDDGTVEIANRAAAALGLAHNAPSAARTTRRKDLARAALAAGGVRATMVARARRAVAFMGSSPEQRGWKRFERPGHRLRVGPPVSSVSPIPGSSVDQRPSVHSRRSSRCDVAQSLR